MNDADYFDLPREKPAPAAPQLPSGVLGAFNEVSRQLQLSEHEKLSFQKELQLFQTWWHSQVPGLPMTRCTREHARAYCEKFLRNLPVADRQNRLLRFASLWQMLRTHDVVTENVFGEQHTSTRFWTMHPEILDVFRGNSSGRAPLKLLPPESTDDETSDAEGEEAEDDEITSVFSSVDTDDGWVPPAPAPAPAAPPVPARSSVTAPPRAAKKDGRMLVNYDSMTTVVGMLDTPDDLRASRDALAIVIAYLKPGLLLTELVQITRGQVLALRDGDMLVAGLRRWPLGAGMKKWLEHRPPETPVFESWRVSDQNGTTSPERMGAGSFGQALIRAGNLHDPPVSITVRSLMQVVAPGAHDSSDADDVPATVEPASPATPEPPPSVHPSPPVRDPVPEAAMPITTTTPEPGFPAVAHPPFTESATNRPTSRSGRHVPVGEDWVDRLVSDIMRAWDGRLMGSLEMIEYVTGEPAHLWQRLVNDGQLPAVRRLDGSGCLVLARALALFIHERSLDNQNGRSSSS